MLLDVCYYCDEPHQNIHLLKKQLDRYNDYLSKID